MNDISGRISLYHSLFLICLILALAFLIVAAILFFVLDIRSAWALKSGRRKRKEIKKIEEKAALSGRLVQRERTNMQYVAQEMKDDMGVRQKARPGIRKVERAVEAATPVTAEIPKTSNYSETSAEQGTAVLQEQATEVLQEMGTQVLAENYVEPVTVDSSTAGLNAEEVTIGKFTIVREVIMIHTEEVI